MIEQVRATGGLTLDVARHFQPIGEIRRIVDQMAAVKLNMLHLHLTDDQGWRFEVKRYPRLTEIGAWRTAPTTSGRPGPRTGGGYTQGGMKALVAYAAANVFDGDPDSYWSTRDEVHTGGLVLDLPLETAETMTGSRGFNLLDNNFKSVDTLIGSLVGAVGRYANFLLNTGPMPWRAVPGGVDLLDAAKPDGVIDRVIATRLRQPKGRP